MTEELPSVSNRWWRAWVTTVLLSCLLAVGSATAWIGALAAHDQVPSRAELCQGYLDLASALNETPEAQNARIRTGAQLAEMADNYPAGKLPNSDPVSEAPRRLRAVLEAPFGTVRDLFAAARPIAVECGLDWRTGSPDGIHLSGG